MNPGLPRKQRLWKVVNQRARGNFNLWWMTVYILLHSGFTTTDELGGRGEVRSADVVKKKKKKRSGGHLPEPEIQIGYGSNPTRRSSPGVYAP